MQNRRRLGIACMAAAIGFFIFPLWRQTDAAPIIVSGPHGFRLAIAVSSRALPAAALPQGGSTPIGLTNGTPHLVTITWNAGTPVAGVTVAGYNIYRSTTSGAQAGSPALNGSTPIPTSATTTACPAGLTSPCNIYVDSAVTPGLSYFYKLDSISTGGNQSALSAEAPSGPVPQNPPVPATPRVAAQ